MYHDNTIWNFTGAKELNIVYCRENRTSRQSDRYLAAKSYFHTAQRCHTSFKRAVICNQIFQSRLQPIPLTLILVLFAPSVIFLLTSPIISPLQIYNAHASKYQSVPTYCWKEVKTLRIHNRGPKCRREVDFRYGLVLPSCKAPRCILAPRLHRLYKLSGRFGEKS